MLTSLSVNQSQIFTALRSLLTTVLPSTVAIVQGLQNRVSEPSGTDFVVMTPLFRERIATNVDTFYDGVFTGSISGNVLTIATVTRGAIYVGSILSGVGVATTTVTAFGTGTGGVGTYTIDTTQTVALQKISAGYQTISQPTKVTVQLDVHGPNASDNAQIISTSFRDLFTVSQFNNTGLDICPLYADDPKQIPYLNAEQQYETRYVIDCVLQANQILTIQSGQQFADTAIFALIGEN